MNEIMYDSDGDPVGYTRPSWEFSWWDVAGVFTFGIAGVLKVTGQGLDMLAREFSAAANYQRDAKAFWRQQMFAEQQQARHDAELKDLLGIPVARDEDIPEAER